jgi:hypothetical protein
MELEDGQSFTVFTLRDGQILRLRGHVHREREAEAVEEERRLAELRELREAHPQLAS